ncbi:MAG: DNA polymerase III subunit beta [Thermoleophilia bacterium]
MTSSDIALEAGLCMRCARADLAAQVGIVARAVSARPSVQVLGGVLIEAGEDALRLAASDLEISLRAQLPAQVERPGKVVVPGRVLADLARALAAEDVEIEHVASERALRIASGSGEYRLHTLAVEDFPALPEPSDSELVAVDARPFLGAVSCVSRAAGRDESRPVLTGILVRIDGGKLVMAATDSYRLAVREVPLERSLGPLEGIIPARALEELRRIAASAEEIHLGVVQNHAVFKIDTTVLTTRRIDGQFPDYVALAPKPEEYVVQASVSRAELLDTIRRAAIVAQRTSPLRLRLGEGELTVSVRSQDLGEARETIPAQTSGEGLEIGFNAEYLRDGVESACAEEIVLKLINPLRPGLIESREEEFWYLLMPIRLAG